METIRIEGTNVTPRVLFEPLKGSLEISGYSRPENARDFYVPLLEWIERFKEWAITNQKNNPTAEPFSFKFRYVYFNSSSAKFVYDLILALSDLQKSNIPLKIYWYFDQDDDELREAGEELSDMANVPMHYVEISR
jgi:hypothetical protein